MLSCPCSRICGAQLPGCGHPHGHPRISWSGGQGLHPPRRSNALQHAVTYCQAPKGPSGADRVQPVDNIVVLLRVIDSGSSVPRKPSYLTEPGSRAQHLQTSRQLGPRTAAHHQKAASEQCGGSVSTAHQRKKPRGFSRDHVPVRAAGQNKGQPGSLGEKSGCAVDGYSAIFLKQA